MSEELPDIMELLIEIENDMNEFREKNKSNATKNIDKRIEEYCEDIDQVRTEYRNSDSFDQLPTNNYFKALEKGIEIALDTNSDLSMRLDYLNKDIKQLTDRNLELENKIEYLEEEMESKAYKGYVKEKFIYLITGMIGAFAILCGLIFANSGKTINYYYNTEPQLSQVPNGVSPLDELDRIRLNKSKEEEITK